MSSAPGLFDELKRRNVFRVGAAYLVVAWLLVEISDTIFPRLGLPEWTVTFVIALLLIGLPLALFLAWAFELTPEGVKRTEEVEQDASVTPQTGRAIDKLILVGMVVVVAVIVADRFLFKESGQGARDLPVETAGVAEREDTTPVSAGAAGDSGVQSPSLVDASGGQPVGALSVAAAQPQASGIAVLPFVNMSPDPENAYFADGISEELLNILGGIEGLKVASRTSAFSFKGKDTPITEIARLLDVQHVLEGSVRKQGQRVRITAQLIDAGSDAHLWSETYERELVDIFRVQEEIALAITAALEDILGTPEVSVDTPTRDLDAYQDFLRGRSRFYQRFELDQAIEDLQAAVDRDPQFAEAWAFLAAATGVVAGGGYPTELDAADLDERSDEAQARALALDPDIPILLAGMGMSLVAQGNVVEGLARLEEAARQVDPDTSPRLWLGLSLSEVGRVDLALPWFQSAHAQDPLVPINHGYLGYAHAVFGREEEAAQLVKRGLELNPNSPYWTQLLAFEAIHQGDTARFAELWRMLDDGEIDRAVLAALADPGQQAAAFAALPPDASPRFLNAARVVLSLVFRDTDRLFEAVGSADRSGQNYMRFAAWLPSLGWLREDPRFYEFMADSGAVAYWEAEGYPGGCRPVDDPAGRRLDCSEYAP
ncbi:tetratricopeptide repeat protein [Wenzhouxiangella sp. XN24]|uniref:tetratricopeptide repeat protein n=1 Tax=Wenzhouxiangella sp. XN24 TaxID=2713569 RepID=UPI0013EA30AB|nr:tetratricopeptide repeat protein [Wenzhouxiangella sp. XN24]NGX15840.1 tetratricopeptide repeat protein [Wenzhouxiangella sp. XN24]